MKILLITQYFPPEIGAGSTRAYENAKRWVKFGADVTVLTNFPNYPDGVIPEKYKGHTSLIESFEGMKVIRIFTFATPNQGFFKRTLAYFAFMFFSVFQGVFKVGFPDVVVATSPPFFVGVSGYLISYFLSAPLVFEVRDLWPESIVQLGQVKNKAIISIMEKLELFLYKKAKIIISVTDSYIPIIFEKGIGKNKIVKITNGVDLNYFSPIRKDEKLIESLNLQTKFVVSYFGTLGLSHAIDKILDTANLLRDNSKIFFLIIGDGAEREKLIRKKEELKLNNVLFIETVGKKELRKYYSISNAMLVPLKNIPLFRTVIPSKIFEIMAMNLPVILSVDGEAKNIIKQANSGLIVEPENSQSLKEAIEKLANDKLLCETLGNNGRKFVELYFDRETLSKKYLQTLEKII